jgi:hypothetical protein
MVILDLQEIRVPLGDDSFAMLQQPYRMEINIPREAKAGQPFNFQFHLEQSDQPLNITYQDGNIFDYYQLNLSLRPDFQNAAINPSGTMTTALLPAQEPAMRWKMEPVGKEAIEGIFWVYLDFVPLQDDVPSTSTALLARNVSIPVTSFCGLNTRWMIIISTVLTIAAIFIGIPQIEFFKRESAHGKKK